jgi:hypothetical protein
MKEERIFQTGNLWQRQKLLIYFARKIGVYLLRINNRLLANFSLKFQRENDMQWQ